jgi:hypothetical protein
MENGCVGEAPTPVDISGATGPVPAELRSYAGDLNARTSTMEAAIADRLSVLRGRTAHQGPISTRFDERPMPRYLDAMG